MSVFVRISRVAAISASLFGMAAGPASALTWSKASVVAGQNSGSLTPGNSNIHPWMAGDPLGPVTIATFGCRPYTLVPDTLNPPHGEACPTASPGVFPLSADTLDGGSWGVQHEINASTNGAADYSSIDSFYTVAAGANGDAAAAWVSRTEAVYASVRPSGSDTWDTPVLLSETSGADPLVTVDKDGNAEIVWADLSAFDGTPGDVHGRSLTADGTLGALQTIASGVVPRFGMDLAGNASGEAVLSWVDTSDSTNTNITVDAVSRDSGGAWGSVQTVDTQPWGDDANLVSAIDPQGHGTVAWNYYAEGPPTAFGIYTSTQDSQGAWGAKQLIPGTDTSMGTGPVSLLGNGNGDLTLVWDSDSTVLMATRASTDTAWSSQTVPAGPAGNGAPVGGIPPAAATNSNGDLVIAWQTAGGSSNPHSGVIATVKPAGGSFDTPTRLDDSSWQAGLSSNDMAAAIDDNGNAAIAWVGQDYDGDGIVAAASTQSASDGFRLDPLGRSPGVAGIASCRATAKMPSLVGTDQDRALSRLRDVPADGGLGIAKANLTVIERHPKTPLSVQIGQVYSETPAAGKTISPCSVKVRVVIYGGPSGITVKDYRNLKELAGKPLSAALELGSVWKIDYWFQPAKISEPTITKVDELSLKDREIRVHVAMPGDPSRYDATLFHGGDTITEVHMPSVGIDNALRTDMGNVNGNGSIFGEKVWHKAVPLSARLIIDTHDAGNSQTRGGAFPEDNLLNSTSTAVTPGPHSVQYVKAPAVIHVNPTTPGEVYVVATIACGTGCWQYGFDVIPVVRPTSAFDSMNGFRFAANGDYDGPASKSLPGLARDAGAQAGPSAAAVGCAWYDLSCRWDNFWNWLTHPGAGTSTAPVATTPVHPVLMCADGSKFSVRADGCPNAPAGRPVYDFGLELYPMLYSDATGLTAGHVYKFKNGTAIDLLDGSSHGIIAAGGGNLQPNEVFGVYGIIRAGKIIAAGAGSIIAAGAGNAVNLHWPVLDAGAYKLASGMYQINRPNGPSGNVVVTPVKYDSGGNIIAAGGGNIIAAGGGNIIAAGAGNLADGYYNVISAGGGNIIAAGAGNIVDYDSILGLMQTSLDGSQTMLTMSDGSRPMPGASNAAFFGGQEGSDHEVPIPSLANPAQYINSSGTPIIAAGAGNINDQLASIIAAGAGNVISAGGGNVISAGGGNLVSDNGSG